MYTATAVLFLAEDGLIDPMGSYLPERLLSYLHGQSSIFTPGTGYFYSNAK
jgi:CubicO group peptidase (beta-lactamase class C family)